ncbi:hypothetical protein N8Q82_07620 [Enterobacter roggenkampii]|uniref:hypothetical protein n=1 Tax=Enterobacter roggenkampii TaxID=1812935 RepID=UPI0021C86A9C|nr:hypothetical protein [Enterobacter roggenkampii]MCU2345860.1 hypothetical protein [Enterobacter roggenkampii]
MIFNGEMVRAILDGRKTQTRRIMKNQPAGDYPDTPALIRSVDGGFQWYGHYGESSIFNCPFGAVGDRIWVRETWNKYGGLLTYRADYDWIEDMKKEMACHESYPKWHPSIHMPRWASRITLEITGVRVERLNDISECDAKAEGAPTECCVIGDKHFLGFRSLWKSIYGDESWRSNPWVWVIEFKVVPNVQDNPA